MNDELEGTLKQSWSNRGTIPAFSWMDRGKSRKHSSRVVGALVWIPTYHLPNTRVEHYRCGISVAYMHTAVSIPNLTYESLQQCKCSFNKMEMFRNFV